MQKEAASAAVELAGFDGEKGGHADREPNGNKNDDAVWIIYLFKCRPPLTSLSLLPRRQQTLQKAETQHWGTPGRTSIRRSIKKNQPPLR
jgi:hypothetical protein